MVCAFVLFCCLWLRSEGVGEKFLFDHLDYIIADELLRFSIFKNILASVNSNSRYAFYVVFYYVHNVLQCLRVCLILRLSDNFFYLVFSGLPLLPENLACDVLHLTPMLTRMTAVAVVTAISDIQ